jgi:hypothetical protein
MYSPTLRLILLVLRETKTPLSTTQLVAATGANLFTVLKLTQKAVNDRLLQREKRGSESFFLLMEVECAKEKS